MNSQDSGIELHGCEIAAIGSVMSIIPFNRIRRELRIAREPRLGFEGDVILARVPDDMRHEKIMIQSLDGHQKELKPGDRILGTLGFRESTTHILGSLPLRPLSAGSHINLLSPGGIVGDVLFIPPSMGEPVRLEHEGFLIHGSGVLTMKDYSIAHTELSNLPPLILIAGTSSEIGKTTLTGKILRLLTEKFGKRVSSVMMSGTGSRADALNHKKAGAIHAHSFIETGLNNSYRCSAVQYSTGIRSLLSMIACEEKPDFIVGELGGDFTWGNNDTILRDRRIMKHARLIVLIVNDVAGALGTQELFSRWQIEEPLVLAHSWERSYGGMSIRFRDLMNRMLLDVNDWDAIERMLRKYLFEINQQSAHNERYLSHALS